MKIRSTRLFFALALISPAPALAADAPIPPPVRVVGIRPLQTKMVLFTGAESSVMEKVAELIRTNPDMVRMVLTRKENKISEITTIVTVTVEYQIPEPL